MSEEDHRGLEGEHEAAEKIPRVQSLAHGNEVTKRTRGNSSAGQKEQSHEILSEDPTSYHRRIEPAEQGKEAARITPRERSREANA
ncbi:hypothetical protein Q3G72_011427 [Acer saccharum]|nr:hypothetical protein Q3G72_011427 [Acer saccharum]